MVEWNYRCPTIYTVESHIDFFDDFRDISSGEKDLVIVGTKTFEKRGYLFLKKGISKLTKRCSKQLI